MVDERITTSADSQTSRFIHAGIKPTDAIKIRVLMTDESTNVEGLALSFNVLETGNWFNTLKEAPVSTISSVFVDSLLAAGTYYLVEKTESKKSKDSSQNNIQGDGNNTYIIVNGDYYYNVPPSE